MSILSELRGRFRAALSGLVESDQLDGLLDMIRPAQDARFGDYQANCAMPLGKRLGRPPRDVAQELVDQLEVGDFCEAPEIAGPGFINLRLRDDWLATRIQQALGDERLGIAASDQPLTYVIDYSSPNVAKPMHVGHIRSTVIGDALSRMLRFQGHRVIADNHLGDWGTQFGMIIYGFKHFVDQQAFEQQSVAELGRLYKLVSQLVAYHDGQRELPHLITRAGELDTEATEAERANQAMPDAKAQKKAAKAVKKLRVQATEAARAVSDLQAKLAVVDADEALHALAGRHADIGSRVLQETALLHEGDPENRRLWNEFLPACRQDIQRIYQRLGIEFDYEHGESFYQEMLAGVVDDFRDRNLAEESEGAICVFLDGFETPMIIRKKDGAFLYATTDLATIRYRVENWHPHAILYVVDHRQSEHFDKLFAAARRWGCGEVDLRHISFGTVLGNDRRPYKTRSGDTVGLEGLLDEAVRRAYEVVRDNDEQKPQGAELSDEQRHNIAQVVGHAAIKYADLAQNRTSDYVFSYDKMVAMEGNTATYMQYSYARTQSIFERGHVDVAALRGGDQPIQLQQPLERALALELLRFEEALDESLVDFRPNLMTSYLFALAKRFSEFYQHPECKVLKADTAEQRESRLRLCDLTGRTIRRGLALLGIEVVDRM